MWLGELMSSNSRYRVTMVAAKELQIFFHDLTDDLETTST
jgi:hypothetical protein